MDTASYLGMLAGSVKPLERSVGFLNDCTNDHLLKIPLENSCARTDAVFTPYPGFKSHVKGKYYLSLSVSVFNEGFCPLK